MFHGLRHARCLLVVVLALSVVVACDSAPDGEERTEDGDADAAVEDAQSAVTPTPGSEPEGPDRGSLPAAVEPDVEARHATGSFVRINRISFTQSTIEVHVTIVNGHTVRQHFAARTVGAITLEDDLGNPYGFLAPDDDVLLTVESGEQLEGELVFTGRLPADARTLTLRFNPEVDETRHNESFRNSAPQMSIEDIEVRAR